MLCIIAQIHVSCLWLLTYLCNKKSATHPKSFKREEQCHQLYCSTETETLLFSKIFKMRFFVYSISHHLISSKILGVKLLLGTFCDETLYITNVCRVISRIIKVALLNNFRTGSWSVLSAHDIIHCTSHLPLIHLLSLFMTNRWHTLYNSYRRSRGHWFEPRSRPVHMIDVEDTIVTIYTCLPTYIQK